MDVTVRVVWLVLGILALQGVVWVPIILRMRSQRGGIEADARRAGEMLVLGPERADYQGWTRRFGYARTMGTLSLTDRRLLFKRPLGRDISIPLSEITGVSDTASIGKLRHTARSYLALTLQDDTEVVFWVGDSARWLEELRARMAA